MIRYDKILINLDLRIDRHRSSTKLTGLLNFLALGWLRAARLPRRGLLWQRQALVAPPGNTGSAYAISIAPSGIGRANRRASSNCTGLLHQKYAVFSARQFGCGSSLRASRLPRLVLRQQRVEKTLTIIETRRLEPREGGGKIDKALARRKRSSNPNVPVTAKPRCRAAVTPSWSSISKRSAFVARASAIASRSPASSAARSPELRSPSTERISSQGGGTAIQARTAAGASACASSSRTARASELFRTDWAEARCRPY